MGGPDGKLGTRETTSQICKNVADSNPELSGICGTNSLGNAVAFISYDGNGIGGVQDSIKNMPINHSFSQDLPLVGPNGTVFASSWDDAMNSTWATGEYPGSAGFPNYYWTGSTNTGDTSYYGTNVANCNNWTSNSGSNNWWGKTQFGTRDSGNWLKSSAYYAECSKCSVCADRAMMCVCVPPS